MSIENNLETITHTLVSIAASLEILAEASTNKTEAPKRTRRSKAQIAADAACQPDKQTLEEAAAERAEAAAEQAEAAAEQAEGTYGDPEVLAEDTKLTAEEVAMLAVSAKLTALQEEADKVKEEIAAEEKQVVKDIAAGEGSINHAQVVTACKQLINLNPSALRGILDHFKAPTLKDVLAKDYPGILNLVNEAING